MSCISGLFTLKMWLTWSIAFELMNSRSGTSSLPNPSREITSSTIRVWYGIRAGVAQPPSNCSIELSRQFPSNAPSWRSSAPVYVDRPGRSFTYGGIS